MPNYIKRTTKVSFPQTSRHTPENFTEEQIWNYCKRMIPMYTGSLHTEEHDKYTQNILASISLQIGKDLVEAYENTIKAGNYCYIENVKHNKDDKTVSCDFAVYYKDETTYKSSVDQFEIDLTELDEESNGFDAKAYLDNREVKVLAIDFHKPYKDPT